MQEFDPSIHGDTTTHSDPQMDLDATSIESSSLDGAGPGGLQIGIEDGQEVDINGDGIADGIAEVTYADLDGDGVADQATVTINADMNGDGQADAVIIIDQFDTDGDGLADKVEVSYGLDTTGDGKVDTSEYASGTITSTPVDTTGDGAVDTISQEVVWDEGSGPSGDMAAGADPEVYSDDAPAGNNGFQRETGESTGGASLSSDAVDDSSSGSAASSAGTISTVIDGQSVDLDAIHDLDGNGVNDTAIVQTSDGNYVVVADVDEDGSADQAILTDAEGNILETAYVDPQTGEWVEGVPAS